MDIIRCPRREGLFSSDLWGHLKSVCPQKHPTRSVCSDRGQHVKYLYMKSSLFVLEHRAYNTPLGLIPFIDWAHNAHSLIVQRRQNAHYVPSL